MLSFSIFRMTGKGKSAQYWTLFLIWYMLLTV